MKMPMISVGRLRVKYDIAIWRHGRIWLLLSAMGIALIALQLFGQARQQAHMHTARAMLTQAQQQFINAQKSKSGGSTSDESSNVLESLDHYTTSQQEVGKILQAIIEIGRTNRVVLAQSEFQTTSEGHGGLRQIQMTLPIRADYSTLRAFIEATLRQLPMVSIDQISIKRESVAQGLMETRLKLSIWVDPQKITNTVPIKSNVGVMAKVKTNE
jgi:hypothetical protein